jgi:hypothetical protein
MHDTTASEPLSAARRASASRTSSTPVSNGRPVRSRASNALTMNPDSISKVATSSPTLPRPITRIELIMFRPLAALMGFSSMP